MPASPGCNYAGFPESPYHALAQKYLGGRVPSLLTFGVKGGFEAGKDFYDALGLIKRLVNIGDAKSLACHPASTTHRQMPAAEQRKAGVTPETIRLSIGIEHKDDIIADLDQALAAAAAGQLRVARHEPGREIRCWAAASNHRGSLHVGLVNNMPDAAMRATELQFARLLKEAAGALDVRLQLFSLRSIPRGELARSRMDGFYADAALPAGRRYRRPDRHRRRAARRRPARRTLLGGAGASDRLGRDRHHLHAVFLPGRPCRGAASGRHRRAGRCRAKLSGVYDSARVEDDPLFFGTAASDAGAAFAPQRRCRRAI